MFQLARKRRAVERQDGSIGARDVTRGADGKPEPKHGRPPVDLFFVTPCLPCFFIQPYVVFSDDSLPQDSVLFARVGTIKETEEL